MNEADPASISAATLAGAPQAAQVEPAAGSLADWLGLLVSSGQDAPDSLVVTVAVVGVGALISVHGSLAVRLGYVAALIRDLARVYETRSRDGREGLLRELDRTFAGSLLADTWSELLRRRRELEAHAPDDRAPIRLTDLLVDRPLIPHGVRRQAMTRMPWLLSGLGLAATLGMLAGGLGGAAIGQPIAAIVGLALRGAFWGIALAALSAALTAVLEGTADAQAARLSQLVERSYRSLTPVEAQLRGAEAQRLGFERVSSLLVQVAQDLRDSLDRGLGRIERSTASAANLVGEEQRRVLELVIDDLSGLLRRGVADQIGSLRSALQRTADQQSALGEGVKTTIEQLVRGAESNARVSGSLERAAEAVDEAAGTIAGSAGELKPLIVHLGEVAGALERAATRVEQAQALASDDAAQRTLEALREDVARIGTQLLEGATALRHSVDTFDARRETVAERDIAQALRNFDDRADALRERIGADADADAEPRRQQAAPAAEPARRGGDLAAAFARLERTGEPAAPAATGLAPQEETTTPREPDPPEDAGPVGRGGFSALLTRYKAPQFSIDELPPDLRELTPDDAARRATDAGPERADEHDIRADGGTRTDEDGRAGEDSSTR